MKIQCDNLNLKQIAESGQTFRWYPVGEDYVIVANHQAVLARQLESGIEIDDYHVIWEHYFDTSRDYNNIMAHYMGKDDYLDAAMDFGSGIRILNQAPFETIMSFIISANNNIKRITSAMNQLSQRYGSYLRTIEGVDYYDFPSAEQLKDVTVDEYRDCGVGYRDSYLYEFVQDVLLGNIDLNAIKVLSDSELKSALMRLKGVGEKVANCIILFAYGRTESFPIDTWIKKILEQEYGVKKNYESFVDAYFDYHGGIAQQYLFFYGRNMKKK